MDLEFSGELWLWKGPAPFHFVTVPEAECQAVRATASVVSYGWGMIPATVRVGETEWSTALWPKDGRYVVPFNDWVRAAERLELGDIVQVQMTIDTDV